VKSSTCLFYRININKVEYPLILVYCCGYQAQQRPRKEEYPTTKIILFQIELEKSISRERIATITVPSESERADLERKGYSITDRYYSVTCYGKEITLVCAECRRGGMCENLCVPDFKVPHRPYPIPVYILLIYLYSTDPEIGQREAAKRTMAEFNLRTFAHTTLGRASKALVKSIEAASESGADTLNGEARGKDAGSPAADIAGATVGCPDDADPNAEKLATDPNKSIVDYLYPLPGRPRGIQLTKRFPSAADTATDRAAARAFIAGRLDAKRGEEFNAAVAAVVLAWVSAAGRLLLTKRAYAAITAPVPCPIMRPP